VNSQQRNEPITASGSGSARDRSLLDALHEKEEQYRAVFNSSVDGLVINAMDGSLVEVNPAFCEMHGYTPDEMLRLHPTEFIHPDSLELFGEYVKAVKRGETYECRAIDIRKDGTLVHVGVRGSVLTYLGRPHILGIVRDVTAQVEAERVLEREVAERTRQLATLLRVSHDVASTLELSPLLRLILEQLQTVVSCTSAVVLELRGDRLTELRAHRVGSSDDVSEGRSVSIAGETTVWEWLANPSPWIINDLWSNSADATIYQRIAGHVYERHPSMRSWMGIPLITRNRVIGIIGLTRDQPDSYTENDGRLATAFADHAATAIENARLYEAAQEEARRTAGLAAIGASLALASSLETMLNGLAECVVRATGAATGGVLLREDGSSIELLTGEYPSVEGRIAAFNRAVREGAALIGRETGAFGRPVVMRNARSKTLDLEAWKPMLPYLRDETWETVVSVPLNAHGRVLGSLRIAYPRGQDPTDDDLVFLAAVAAQAAIAVENARLFTEAQGKAALEERQRLARELHDSVSQALYGIGLGARTARALIDRDPPKAAEPLDYVLSLTEAGLAEMRALIFELRPESLAHEGLVAALERQATLLRARHGLEVRTEFCDEPSLALDQKEALYRVAQEAANNVVKHARANQVVMRLGIEARLARLEIFDDGAGFDPKQDFPGHLGLRSMNERIENARGTLEISSAPGTGTVVRAALPAELKAVPPND
jgi:PAS domain S-box-containing protein